MKKAPKRYTLAEMRPIVLGYTNYDGTKKAYCAIHNLAPHTLDYWRKRIRVIDGSSKQAKGQELKASKKNASNVTKRGGFVSVPIPSQAFTSSFEAWTGYTLYLPDGKRLDLPPNTPIQILSHLLQTQLPCLP